MQMYFFLNIKFAHIMNDRLTKSLSASLYDSLNQSLQPLLCLPVSLLVRSETIVCKQLTFGYLANPRGSDMTTGVDRHQGFGMVRCIKQRKDKTL